MNTQGVEMSPHHTASPGITGAHVHAPGPRGYGRRTQNGGNGAARAALVLGVIGLGTSVVIVGGLLGVLGLVLGVVALRKAGRTGVGRGGAVAGVVTSALAIAVSITAAFFLVWYANETQECYQPDTFQQYKQCVHDQFDGN
ncbi:DUF4190 domain-containing protein [Streptomyces spectabilis]|uniref:DUF4190 domain-containing protein n=1 Tax=Streptomyces spectabilis TaxID=68270 RepID=A0A5P2XDZ7_STRST|nr:DUF4190 domain-containing protein [Streptomyces spectabilis]MBB5105025.1 uncharacterized protein HemX [Streptomyces spectabilis]MCI3905755.1 DUF4190 domain-containing protein [Streptomyces spectabilis]QEV62701.1 DUF4190 domain-containing protein [Streptomyces spectabilis]GGV06848.1 hypothetical protein GCM10010245_13870 [Streptomyces spectabilis]